MKTFKQCLPESWGFEKLNPQLDPSEFNDMSASIADFVNNHFGGKAWFDGGSYSYLIDTSKPNILKASDGSVIKCKNIAQGLKDYTQTFGNLVSDFKDGDDFSKDDFRPVKKAARNDRADQAAHELGEASGNFDAVRAADWESDWPDLNADQLAQVKEVLLAQQKEVRRARAYGERGNHDAAEDGISDALSYLGRLLDEKGISDLKRLSGLR